MIARKILMFSVLILSVFSIAWLDPYRDAVSSGNDEYGSKKYNNAKRYYEKAEKYAPAEDDKKKLSLNMADADFMLEDYDGAIAGFQRAIQSDDREVQKKAFFNTGNAYLKQGNYREAINAYVNALKIDPNYDKAKKNIEYILKHMNNKDNKRDNKDNKDKDKRKDSDKSQQNKKQDPKRQQGKDRQQADNQMNREQIQNILRSLQQSPVRRQKGSSGERRKLEKFW
ncbi:MAG: tetratricopeptide repeat protein [Spirochaetes bacterium]|nr:tetratricopeptide repeat protein [Spirochaetota bacterium]